MMDLKGYQAQGGGSKREDGKSVDPGCHRVDGEERSRLDYPWVRVGVEKESHFWRESGGKAELKSILGISRT